MRARSARVRARSGRRARVTLGALARETWRDMTSGTAWIGIWTSSSRPPPRREDQPRRADSSQKPGCQRTTKPPSPPSASLNRARRSTGRHAGRSPELDGVKGAIAIRKATEAVTPAAMPSASLQTWEYTGDAGKGLGDTIPGGWASSPPSRSRAHSASPPTTRSPWNPGVELVKVYAWDETDGLVRATPTRRSCPCRPGPLRRLLGAALAAQPRRRLPHAPRRHPRRRAPA